MPPQAYPSNLSDAELRKLKPLLPTANQIGSPRRVKLRGVFKVVRSVEWLHLDNLNSYGRFNINSRFLHYKFDFVFFKLFRYSFIR